MIENITNSGGGLSIWLGLLAFCLISSSFVLSINITKSEDAPRRRKNFRAISRKSLMKERLEDTVNKNIEYKKRKTKEGLILQAGHNFSILDLYLMQIGAAALLGLLFMFVLDNAFVSIVMATIGFLAPTQILNMQRNKRKEKLSVQVGTFINVVIARYEMLNDFSESLRMSLDECYGQEPLASEIRTTIMDIDLGLSVLEALEGLSLRTGDKYIQKLSTNYQIASSIGTKEARKKLLGYVIDEYNKESVAKAQLKKELKGPVMEAYLMCAMVPGVMVMQAFMTEGYVEFMTTDPLGKIGLGVIVGCIFAGITFIKLKVGAPLD